MKAVLHTRYGSPDLLEVGEAPKPEPGPDQVLVRVRAASVHADIWHTVEGRPILVRMMGNGFFGPKTSIPGSDMAGVVEEVGANVTRFQLGDAVFGETTVNNQWSNGGAFAEYVCVLADNLAPMPDTVTFEQATVVPAAGYIALMALRDAGIAGPGQHLLVNGAAGGVGSLAIQIAKARGAQVTAVDHTSKLDFLRQLGADHVVDYTTTDPTLGDPQYDGIIDVASNLKLEDCARVLRPTGLYVMIGHDHYGAEGGKVLGTLPKMFRLMSRRRPHLSQVSMEMPSQAESIATLGQHVANGEIRPVVGRTYPLEQVREAMRALVSGEVNGKIVLTL